jgi:hypothetical protein
MKNAISGISAVLLAFAVAVGAEAQSDRPGVAGGDSRVCANPVRSEPIVLWDVTGTNFAGQLIHGTLAVYNNGFASVSSFQTGDVRSVAVGREAVRGLRRELVEAGALAICDGDAVTDMPLTTVTLLGGAPDAGSHTFSYWVPADEYAPIQQLIDDFLATYFRGFSLY